MCKRKEGRDGWLRGGCWGMTSRGLRHINDDVIKVYLEGQGVKGVREG